MNIFINLYGKRIDTVPKQNGHDKCQARNDVAESGSYYRRSITDSSVE